MAIVLGVPNFRIFTVINDKLLYNHFAHCYKRCVNVNITPLPEMANFNTQYFILSKVYTNEVMIVVKNSYTMVCLPVCEIINSLKVNGFSCIPDKNIHVFYLDRQFLSHPYHLTQNWIKIMCI